MLSFGDQDAACRLDLVHWTRGGRGLHFDVLLREVANVGTCQPSVEHTPTQDAATCPSTQISPVSPTICKVGEI